MDSANNMDMNNKNAYRIWKIGTWNIKSLTGKEHELIQEFEKEELDILGICETKKKGQGIQEMEGGHLLLYSGVTNEMRAKRGVGCIIRKDHVKNLTKWTFVSDRILKIDMKIGTQEITTIIIIYGPDENERAASKDEFWEKLTDVSENTTGRLIILGDMNSRVGKRTGNVSHDVIGKYGEEHTNNNGRRLIDFCLQNELIITNTFYQHKSIHMYTREMKSRNERSVIDYLLTKRTFRKEVMDVRVQRGAEIGSDHYLVKAKLRIRDRTHETPNQIQHKVSNEVIKAYKLRDPLIAKDYKDTTEGKIANIKVEWRDWSLEKMWQAFREICLTSASETCGKMIINRNRKQTRWWNEEIRNEVRQKKQKWQKYLVSKSRESYHEYKQQRRKVKELIQQAKNRSWEEFGTKMEQDRWGNQKLFYKVLKNARKEKPNIIRQVKGKNNQILTSENEIMERWKEYFYELLNKDTSTSVANQVAEFSTESIIDEEMEDAITNEELTMAIKECKRGKSAGNDKITSEMLKNLGKEGEEMLTNIFNKIWNEGHVPQDWTTGIIMPIHKKGDTRNCSNYRGITLLSIASKLYESVIEKRLRIQIEPQLEEAQSGFRKGRSTQDHIFTIKQIIEKTRTKNTKVFVAFVDLEKAFDRVSLKTVWESLQRRGIQPKIIRTIQRLYTNNKNYVRKDNMQSETFTVNDGLRQGGVLSPILFIIIMDDIIKEAQKSTKKAHIGYNNLKAVNLSECAFADDLLICANRESDLQHNLNVWNSELCKRNLKINVNKTKVMVIGKDTRKINIKINQQQLEQVETYKYLGVKIRSDGSMEDEINERINNATRTYYALNRVLIGKREISRSTKMMVFQTIYKPILTYGSESWVLTERTKSKLQAMELKYLRRVKGVTRMDKLRNDDIRAELGVKSIIHGIESQQLRWFGHLSRMNDDRPVKQIWKAGVEKNRAPGRPRKTWNDSVATILNNRRLTWREASNMAQNKEQWARTVHATDI